ncbi:MAG: hypothetical protein E7314_03985 [Clostridiales bacterium]|nr:hypothetical protein [Clostridiales bacterium]
MKIINLNTLKSKVKIRTCESCREKNNISAEEIKWAPLSGFYNENGGYHYFKCKYCGNKNFIPERVAQKIIKNTGNGE